MNEPQEPKKNSVPWIWILLATGGAAAVAAYYLGRRTGVELGDAKIEEFARDVQAGDKEKEAEISKTTNRLIGKIVQLSERAQSS